MDLAENNRLLDQEPGFGNPPADSPDLLRSLFSPKSGCTPDSGFGCYDQIFATQYFDQFKELVE